PPAQPAPPKEEEKAPPPPPEPTVRMAAPPVAPNEAKKAPAIDLDKALGSTLQGIAGLEDSTVRRLKAKSESELSKKLEETLSGVKLGAPRYAEPAPPPAPPAPPKAEEKPAPAPAPAPGAPEAEAGKPPQAPAAEAPKTPPELEKTPTKEGVPFGNYLLIDKIAVGGMAELFKARQNGLEGFKRIVAIKRILPHLAANQEFVTMFTDEAKLAAQLNHPNIGHIYDLGKLEDSYFIAMEYVDGRDLRTILKELDSRQAKMPLRVAVYIAQKVCAALHYAHTAKDVDGKPMDLVHRDVSPQNIILSTTGEVKLVDFGIAKAASKASHTQSGALKGKLLYMSPEQAWGKTINHQADIFALGSVLWEMLTGRKLFYGDSEMSILEKVREAKVEPPRKYREEIPEELERIVLKALEKDLGARYATCQALQADLERFAYEEWETLPSAYDAAAFLNGFFPEVYTREILGTLKKEPEGAPQEARPSRPGKPPKSQRGKPAPLPKKEKAAEAPPPQSAEPPKAPAPPPPSPPKPQPKAAEPPKAPPPPPKTVEETTGSRMFGDVVEKTQGSKKTLVAVGGAAAALVVILVLVFALRGKKPPAPPPESASAPATEQPKPAETPPAPAPPPGVQTPAPVPPAAGAPQATEAEIAAARRTATAAFTAFSKSVTDLEQAGAGQFVPDSLNSLKQSQTNLQALLRRARTPEEFKAAEDGSRQGAALAEQVKTQLDEAKAAAEREAARKAAEAEAARKAQEEAAKKAAEEEAQKQAQAGKAKPGDFVDLWAVDVKPRETQKVPVAYTPQARQNKVQGTVYVEVAISETGQVTSATVVRGLKPDYGLHDACVKAALETRYSPAIKDGVPVKTKMTYPVVFKIQ
ncbi:MAG: TonB family protein, partial [Acidobacteriota bacterium]